MPIKKSATPGVLLREVARMYIRAQRTVVGSGRRTITQCYLLSELGRSGPLPLSELGARVGLEKSWASRAIDSLVAAGLVVKQANPADARSQFVVLTPQGGQVVREMNQAVDGHAEQLLSSLSEADKRNIDTALRQLIAVLRDDPAVIGGGPVVGWWSPTGGTAEKP